MCGFEERELPQRPTGCRQPVKVQECTGVWHNAGCRQLSILRPSGTEQTRPELLISLCVILYAQLSHERVMSGQWALFPYAEYPVSKLPLTLALAPAPLLLRPPQGLHDVPRAAAHTPLPLLGPGWLPSLHSDLDVGVQPLTALGLVSSPSGPPRHPEPRHTSAQRGVPSGVPLSHHPACPCGSPSWGHAGKWLTNSALEALARRPGLTPSQHSHGHAWAGRAVSSGGSGSLSFTPSPDSPTRHCCLHGGTV